MRILLGIVGVIFSLLLLVYRVPVRKFMGQVDWAEAKLGPGGTYTLLIIVAVGIFFFSLMYMTDSFGFIFGDSAFTFFDSVK